MGGPPPDYSHTTDGVEAGLAPAAAAVYPCPKCGKESKAHNVFQDGEDGPEPVPGSRICSNRQCRHEFNLSEMMH